DTEYQTIVAAGALAVIAHWSRSRHQHQDQICAGWDSHILTAYHRYRLVWNLYPPLLFGAAIYRTLAAGSRGYGRQDSHRFHGDRQQSVVFLVFDLCAARARTARLVETAGLPSRSDSRPQRSLAYRMVRYRSVRSSQDDLDSRDEWSIRSCIDGQRGPVS